VHAEDVVLVVGNDSVSGTDEPGVALSLWIYGGPGDDALDGGTGADVLDGGDGRDGLNGGPGKDVVLGGPGNDYLSDGDTDVDRVEGGAGDDDFFGGAGPVSFKGGPGDDNLTGGDGDDELEGGTGDDNLVGGRGDDKLNAGPGDDDVDGGRGADRIDTADAQAEHSLTCGQGGDQLIADGRDPVNVDCETFDGGRVSAGATSVSLAVACPGGCTSGRIVLTAGGKRLGSGKISRSVARVRFNRRVSRKVTVRATIVARDSAGRSYRSRGRYELR
jgi:Ca2+-binding RTX toxin-like protein